MDQPYNFRDILTTNPSTNVLHTLRKAVEDGDIYTIDSLTRSHHVLSDLLIYLNQPKFSTASYIDNSKILLREVLRHNVGMHDLEMLLTEYSGNQWMANIIYQVLEEKIHLHPRSIVRLRGPVSFIFYHEAEGRRILLLGDKHSRGNISSCQNDYDVLNWVLSLSTVAPECLDLFAETAYLSEPLVARSVFKGDSPLIDLAQYFNEYTVGQEHVTINDHLRYHYIDMRVIKTMINGKFFNLSIFSFNTNMFRILSSPNRTSQDPRTIDVNPFITRVRVLIDYMMGKTDKQVRLGEQLFIELYDSLSIEAFGRPLSRDQEIREVDSITLHTIKTYMNSYRAIVNKTRGKFIGDLSRFDYTFHMMVLTRIRAFKREMGQEQVSGQVLGQVSGVKVHRLLNILCNIPMEYYSLLRMFGSYTHRDRGPVSCRDILYNKNIICYVGDNHVSSYKVFINEYCKVKPSIEIANPRSVDDWSQCISLPREFDYFS